MEKNLRKRLINASSLLKKSIENKIKHVFMDKLLKLRDINSNSQIFHHKNEIERDLNTGLFHCKSLFLCSLMSVLEFMGRKFK